MIGALPGALKAVGEHPVLIVPAYKSILDNLRATSMVSGLSVQVGAQLENFSVLSARDPQGVEMYLIDHPEFFARSGIYGEQGRDFPDNMRRFIFFGRAAATIAADLIKPDLVHAHDWHASAAPIVMRADPALAKRFAETLSVFTLHNLAFQGLGEPEDFSLLNLEPKYFSMDCLEFFGRLNLMKGAIVLADGVSTVSPSYAREVTTDPELGFGLEGVLRAKGANFVGILNGADYNEWDPARDRDIEVNYSAARPAGKRSCTRALREALGLIDSDDWPLVGMVTRMTSQKGVDLIRDALGKVMSLDLQLVMLASGDPELEQFFHDAEKLYPDKLRVIVGFNNPMAHRIQAGSNAFLMPSRFEPCGLTQMYALRYGTAPVVRATGGLRDTVSEFEARSGTGNGFVFEDFDADQMVTALSRMITTFRDRKAWRKLTANCFAADFSWEHAARKYASSFSELRKNRSLS